MSAERLPDGSTSRFIPTIKVRVQSHSRAEYRIGKDREAIHNQKDRAVADPGGMQRFRDHVTMQGTPGGVFTALVCLRHALPARVLSMPNAVRMRIGYKPLRTEWLLLQAAPQKAQVKDADCVRRLPSPCDPRPKNC